MEPTGVGSGAPHHLARSFDAGPFVALEGQGRVGTEVDEAARQLAAAGVGSAVFYPLPIPRQPLYRELGYDDALPVADRLSREVLALPVHPGLEASDVARVAEAVNALLEKRPPQYTGR